MFTKYLLPRASTGRMIFLTAWVVLIYILRHSPLVKFIGSSLFNYLLIPGLWLGLAFIIHLFPQPRPKAKLKLRESIYMWACVFGIIFVAVSVMAGIIDGFGRSPYNHSIRGIALNILTVGAMILGRELFRGFILNTSLKKESYIVFVGIAAFMTFMSLSPNKFTDLKNYVDAIKFIAQHLAPEFSHNLLAVYLAYIGGPLASIIYMGVLQGFHWLSPILPNLKWITTALVGILCPIFSLISMQNIYLKESKTLKRRDEDNESLLSWMGTCLLSIGIIWFTVGVFPIFPSVIATGSMEPMILPGDVILIKKIDPSLVEVGDVIQFKRDAILISHRVINIVEEKDGKSYQTKGDNNSTEDRELVKPEQVKGKIIYVIPKIGWPTLLIKSKSDVPLDEVQF